MARLDRSGDAPSEAQRFLSWLRRALRPSGDLPRLRGRLLVLATLCSDFLSALQLHPACHELPLDQMLLGPMGVEGFTRVIEGPAEVAGLELEPGLSPRMVHDTQTGDALPLLAAPGRA